MIAVISDIHGNYPALRSVLGELAASGITEIYCLGDVSGYYCMINECVTMLMEYGVVHLMGNHDYYLITGNPCPRSSSVNTTIQYQRKIISEKNYQWLKQGRHFIITEKTQMVHGGWANLLDEYISVDTGMDYFTGLPGDIFFSGHTHRPLLMGGGGKTYCNPGSVGQPRDGNPMPSYAVTDLVSAELRRTTYDIDEISFAMKRAGFEKKYYENLYSGTGLSSGPIK